MLEGSVSSSRRPGTPPHSALHIFPEFSSYFPPRSFFLVFFSLSAVCCVPFFDSANNFTTINSKYCSIFPVCSRSMADSSVFSVRLLFLFSHPPNRDRNQWLPYPSPRPPSFPLFPPPFLLPFLVTHHPSLVLTLIFIKFTNDFITCSTE